jgi:hypothetical protein
MVLGRRTFSWRSDVRGLVTVALLALLTLATASALVVVVLLLTRLVLGGTGT